MSIDAMKQALEALERGETRLRYQAIETLRAAIEQTHDWDEVEALQASLREHMAEIHRLRAALEQAQKPVAWAYPEGLEALKSGKPWVVYGRDGNGAHPDGVERIPLYLASRQWQGLTGDEVNEFAAGCHLGSSVQGAIQKAEAKLKEKNT